MDQSSTVTLQEFYCSREREKHRNQRLLEHTSKHQGSTEIFTDSSQSDSCVGFAAMSSRETVGGICLPPGASVFTAEPHAILSAVKMTKKLESHSIVVYSDSRSALQTVDRLKRITPAGVGNLNLACTDVRSTQNNNSLLVSFSYLHSWEQTN